MPFQKNQSGNQQGRKPGTKSKIGRPSLYSSPETLQKKINDYFDGGYEKISLGNKAPAPTISGLAYFLGFQTRQSLFDYEKRSNEFSYIIKRARLRVEANYEQMLQGNFCAGAIFALKNLGWSDKQEVEHSVGFEMNLDDARNRLAKAIGLELKKEE